jgi:RNA polymerase sigma factor (sigma-70 family)
VLLLAAIGPDDPADDRAEGFGALYRRYEAPVLRYFMRRVGDPEVAADLAGETFAAALRTWATSRPLAEHEAAWLFSVARSKLVDSLRRGRVEDAARRELGMQPIVLHDSELARVAELDDKPLTALLDSLPADQLAAVRARVLEERPYAEIARELKISEQVVRKRVSRGLSTLRRRLLEATR